MRVDSSEMPQRNGANKAFQADDQTDTIKS